MKETITLWIWLELRQKYNIRNRRLHNKGGWAGVSGRFHLLAIYK